MMRLQRRNFSAAAAAATTALVAMTLFIAATAPHTHAWVVPPHSLSSGRTFSHHYIMATTLAGTTSTWPAVSSFASSTFSAASFPNTIAGAPRHHYSATTLWAMADSPPPPTTFREAEVLGLRLMQEGDYEGALDAFQKGLKLPGSRPDVVRTKLTSGPSPVGGATGGTESTPVLVLDEFELQAAHYNMACAHALLGNSAEAVANLRLAFENGFDNYATVRADPDLGRLADDNEFIYLMEKYDPQQGPFNPFGFLKKA